MITPEQALENLQTIKDRYTWSSGADEALDMGIMAIREKMSREECEEAEDETDN